MDLVREFVQRAKEVEILIDVMPSKQDAEAIVSTLRYASFSRITILTRADQNARIENMEPEMRAANAEYKQALAEARTSTPRTVGRRNADHGDIEALHDEYKASLAALLAGSTQGPLPSSG